jgi:2,4-didehydro-3-deoxy-L-rhamnonate hydrolase
MARLCRFNESHLGIVAGETIYDVTAALGCIPAYRWPLPEADLLIRHLQEILGRGHALTANAPRFPLDEVRLSSPIANPPKVIGAPVNYLRHQAEAIADGGVNFDKDVKTIEHYGLFLKSSTSVVGPSEGVIISHPERRTDHELELVVVIGEGGRKITERDALNHVAGYTIGLDMTIRGPEDRSLRKSLDSYTVMGPWLVTADEIPDPNSLTLQLLVNGELKQRASTRDLIFNVQRLVAHASSYYRLCPGDVIFTGTPEGVGPVKPGDRLTCTIEGIGSMTLDVRAER